MHVGHILPLHSSAHCLRGKFHASELLAHRFLTGITPQKVREEDGSRKASCLLFPNPWHLWRQPFFVCSLRGREGSQLVTGRPTLPHPFTSFHLANHFFIEPGLWYPNCTLPGPDWKEIIGGCLLPLLNLCRTSWDKVLGKHHI